MIDSALQKPFGDEDGELEDHAAGPHPVIGGIASLVILSAMGSLGVAALRRLNVGLDPLEELAYGLPLGVIVASLATLLLAIAFGLSAELVVVVALLWAGGAIALWPGLLWQLRDRLEAAGSHPLGLLDGGSIPSVANPNVTGPTHINHVRLGAVRRSLAGRVSLLPTLVLGAFVVRWIFLWRGAITFDASGIWVGQINVWGDWPQHLGDVASFAYADNFPPQHPRYAGIPYAYHYLSSLTAAMMVKVGMRPTSALTLHSFVFSVVVALGLYAFARRLTRDRGIATMSVVLYLLGGGLGWWLTAAEMNRTHRVWHTLLHDPWNIGLERSTNFRWENVYLANIVPQRAQLYGLPLSLLTLTLLVIAIRSRQRRSFLAAGVAVGLLPFAHLGPLPTLALITGCLFLFFPARIWAYFFAPWIVLTLPQLYLMQGGIGASGNKIYWHWGWIAAPDSLGWFWLKNLGWFVPLLIVALLTRDLVPPLERRVLWAFMPVFVVANLFALQPDPFDNVKLLVYWFLGVSILVAALLVRAWRTYRAPVVRCVFVGVVATLLLSGLLANLEQALGLDRNQWVTAEEETLAAEVRAKTPPHAVFAVGERHDDPIPMLTGREVVMSFPGWLWTRGINYGQREQDLRAIFAFAPNARQLMRKYKVDYVVIGPDERANMGANEAAFRAAYPVIIQTPNYAVFAVHQGQ